MCDAVHRILRSGGVFYLSILHTRSAEPRTLKRKLMAALYPFVPAGMRNRLDKRWLDLSLSEAEVRKIIEASRFGGGLIEQETILPDSFSGRHHYCTLRKS